MDLARDFFARLLIGRSVVSERDEIEAAIHEYYLGHSKAALLFALHQVFEAVDQSAPFAARGARATRPPAMPARKGREADDPARRAARPTTPAGRAARHNCGRERWTPWHVVGVAAARI